MVNCFSSGLIGVLSLARWKFSAGVDAGEAEFEDADDFAPAVQAPAEKAEHPEIGALPKGGHAAAALGDESAQAPAIAQGFPETCAHKGPAPEQHTAGQGFHEQ